MAENKEIRKKAAKILGIKNENIEEMKILRHSIDARKGQLMDVYQVAVSCSNEDKIIQKQGKKQQVDFSVYREVKYDFWKKRKLNCYERTKLEHSPVIIGAGPAGYFCGLMLAEHGYKPIIFERGRCVEERKEDVYNFFQGKKLLLNSNVQFGEGGAGAFSDGKLNTLVKDQDGRSKKVLEMFVSYGAKEDILVEQKPHVGTDILHNVLVNMRKDYLAKGGQIFFENQVTGFDIENGVLKGILLNNGQKIETEVCVLAIGHSARDTFNVLAQTEIEMEQKAFAVGFRVEHPQELVNESQYGEDYPKALPAAPYKVTAKTESGRGVYSFCMCPGGYVVNASSEQDALAVNGMSYHARDSKNANSAMIVSVTPKDYPDNSPLAGVHFQEALEKRAYALGNGKIPQQLLIDFENNIASKSYGAFASETKGATQFANMRSLFPEEINEAFLEGMHKIGEKIKGFDRDDVILSGVESRTSSPVRISRDEMFESNIKGIYPCGEGAGYAGGIMSAAMDGMKIAEKIAELYDID